MYPISDVRYPNSDIINIVLPCFINQRHCWPHLSFQLSRKWSNYCPYKPPTSEQKHISLHRHSQIGEQLSVFAMSSRIIHICITFFHFVPKTLSFTMFITITLMIHSHTYGFVMVCPKTGNRNQKSNCFVTEKKLSPSRSRYHSDLPWSRGNLRSAVHVQGDRTFFSTGVIKVYSGSSKMFLLVLWLSLHLLYWALF